MASVVLIQARKRRASSSEACLTSAGAVRVTLEGGGGIVDLPLGVRTLRRNARDCESTS